jgi:hypothetical protein
LITLPATLWGKLPLEAGAGWKYGSMSIKYSVSIDVPRLEDGLRFYRDALGLSEIARPFPSYVILKCGNAEIGLIEKAAGTTPAKGTNDVRRLSDTGHQFISTFTSMILKLFWQWQ